MGERRSCPGHRLIHRPGTWPNPPRQRAGSGHLGSQRRSGPSGPDDPRPGTALPRSRTPPGHQRASQGAGLREPDRCRGRRRPPRRPVRPVGLRRRPAERRCEPAAAGTTEHWLWTPLPRRFDWAGLAIATPIIAAGAVPWRFGATDYRDVLALNNRHKRLPAPPGQVPLHGTTLLLTRCLTTSLP